MPAGPLIPAMGQVPPSGVMLLADVALVPNALYPASGGPTMQIKCNKQYTDT